MGPPTRLPVITLRRFESLISSKTVRVTDVANYCRSLAVAGEEVLALNAFATITSREEVIEQASASQERWDAGTPLSPIDGLPVAVKANLAVSNQPLTAGSSILGADRVAAATTTTSSASTPPPAAVGYTADVVRSLQNSGAIVMGITRMDEFGMGSLGTNVPAGAKQEPTKNPLSCMPVDARTKWDVFGQQQDWKDILQLSPERILEMHQHWAEAPRLDKPVSAGGSSCGSATSVAHGSSLLSLGSDTGGSVRLPAAWCHLAGIRPTYGRLSRHGLVNYASSFDTVGMLANSSECIARAFAHLLHCNNPLRDSTLSPQSKEYSLWPSETMDDTDDSKADVPLSGLKVGIPQAFSVEECPPSVREAWSRSAELLSKAGASVEIVPETSITPQVLQRSLASYIILVCAEASSNLARYDGFRYGGVTNDDAAKGALQWNPDTSPFTLLEHQYAAARTKGFGSEVIRRIFCGTAALSASQFHTHYEGAAKLRAELTEQFHTTLQDYDLLLVPTSVFPPPSLDTEMDPTQVFANDVMTIPASLAGLPALSVPMEHATTIGGISDFNQAMQLIGRPFEESKLLRAGMAIDRFQHS